MVKKIRMLFNQNSTLDKLLVFPIAPFELLPDRLQDALDSFSSPENKKSVK